MLMSQIHVSTIRMASVGLMALTAPGLALAASISQDRINADDARTYLGSGTGIVVGIIDSGVDYSRSGLSGNDSLGRSRLLGSGNFASDGNASTKSDHATGVAAMALSSDAIYYGSASDARYINARVINSSGGSTNSTVLNGTGYAVTTAKNAGAPLILNYSLNNTSDGSTGSVNGTSTLSLMADYLSGTLHIPVVVSAGNFGNYPVHAPTGPGDAYNVLTVGETWSNGTNHIFDQPSFNSAWGPTGDGRSKPDLVAPGEYVTTLKATSGTQSVAGTSFAAPAVTGILASQMGYGVAHGLSIDPKVLKATMLNSAEKINSFNSSSQLADWSPNAASTVNGVYTVTQPLSARDGAGQVDGQALYEQYAAGEYADGAVSGTGWDLGAVGKSSFKDYEFTSAALDAWLTVTLTWDRHVGWNDRNGNNAIDSADSFSQTAILSNLDLQVFRDGQLIATSKSALDNLEHLSFALSQAASYTIRVIRAADTNSISSEEYALAWSVSPYVPIPEPTSLGLLALVVGVCVSGRERGRWVASPRR